MSMITRVATLLIALFAAGPAPGQTGYPARPVRVVVPFAPGGPSDVIARLLAQKFSESLGQQFYVENHAGGGGNLGTALAARTAPDGYTMLVASSSFMINPGLYAKIPYDPYTDFDPVTEIATTPNVLVVHPSVAVKSVRELVELIRANPGKYSYANPGTRSPPPVRRDVQARAQARHGCGAVSGRWADDSVRHWRSHADCIFVDAPRCAADQGRQTARARRDERPAKHCGARRADHGRSRRGGSGRRYPAGHPASERCPREAIDLLYRETVRVIALSDIKQKLAAIGFGPIGSTPALVRMLAVLGLISTGLYHALVYWALHYTTAINAQLLNSTIPLGVMLIGWLAFGARPGAREWLGFAVSFVGVAAILSHGDWHRLLALELNAGDLLVLVAMVAWSFYTLLLPRRPLELSPFAYIFVVGAFGLVGLAPFYAWELATGRGTFVVTPEAVAGIAYCAILASIVTTATLNFGVDRVGATRTSFFTHLVPVFGAALGVALLGERLGWYHLAGFAFILAGIALSNGALGALSKALRPG